VFIGPHVHVIVYLDFKYLCSYGHGDEEDPAVASPENKPRILLMGLRR